MSDLFAYFHSRTDENLCNAALSKFIPSIIVRSHYPCFTSSLFLGFLGGVELAAYGITYYLTFIATMVCIYQDRLPYWSF